MHKITLTIVYFTAREHIKFALGLNKLSNGIKLQFIAK
jgi:hypothetical protein